MRHLTTLRYIDAVVREKSIRKAAEKMAITATALNRRILALEDELGQPVFDRLPRGVRLNAAGELFIRHIRTVLSDMERVRSQIADLSGVRRGVVNIAATGDALGGFVAETVARYREAHPAVTFHIVERDGEQAERALEHYQADIALVFAPVRSASFHVTATARQTIHAVMAHDHPLAQKRILRLRDCADYPLILPSPTGGVRQLTDAGFIYKSVTPRRMIESDCADFVSHYLRHERALGVRIPVALSAAGLAHQGLTSRPFAGKDVASGVLHLGHLQGRVLPVAAAKFLDEMMRALGAAYPDDTEQ